LIETSNLTRKFGDVTAVEDLTLHVGEGEVFGFLGPNGAGKTTTIRMLACLISKTTGIGSPVVEMIQKALPLATVVPVYITGGFSSTADYDEGHISKTELVSLITAAFESGSLRIAEGVKEAENLISELSTYELRRSESGHTTYGAMTGGSFDDLVTALGLSLFSAVTWGSSSQILMW
jgi:energy-coupling factor transporter ATP-binding protein EcfA2